MHAQATRQSIRPRQVDFNKQLAIVRDFEELDATDGLALKEGDVGAGLGPGDVLVPPAGVRGRVTCLLLSLSHVACLMPGCSCMAVCATIPLARKHVHHNCTHSVVPSSSGRTIRWAASTTPQEAEAKRDPCA